MAPALILDQCSKRFPNCEFPKTLISTFPLVFASTRSANFFAATSWVVGPGGATCPNLRVRSAQRTADGNTHRIALKRNTPATKTTPLFIRHLLEMFFSSRKNHCSLNETFRRVSSVL